MAASEQHPWRHLSQLRQVKPFSLNLWLWGETTRVQNTCVPLRWVSLFQAFSNTISHYAFSWSTSQRWCLDFFRTEDDILRVRTKVTVCYHSKLCLPQTISNRLSSPLSSQKQLVCFCQQSSSIVCKKYQKVKIGVLPLVSKKISSTIKIIKGFWNLGFTVSDGFLQKKTQLRVETVLSSLRFQNDSRTCTEFTIFSNCKNHADKGLLLNLQVQVQDLYFDILGLEMSLHRGL